MAKRKLNDRPVTSSAKVDMYETTVGLLAAMYSEIQELSKKKPDATLNGSKVKVINRLLNDVRLVLADEPEVKYLDVLSDADLPQYSDVVIALSQYVHAMKAFSEKYRGYDVLSSTRRWFTLENP